MVFARLVTAHEVFHGLVGGKVDGVCRAWINDDMTSVSTRKKKRPSIRRVRDEGPAHGVPAPTTTLDMPRHKLRMPSVLAIL